MVQRVLIIDDESDVQRYLGALLEDEGFEVMIASDGASGLMMARTMHPDLVTLDITMPGMSGVEVFLVLRKHPALQHLPVVVISGVMEGRGMLAETGVRPPEAHMDKPVDRERLLACIRGLLGGP